MLGRHPAHPLTAACWLPPADGAVWTIAHTAVGQFRHHFNQHLTLPLPNYLYHLHQAAGRATL
jgi:hypothetical protein